LANRQKILSGEIVVYLQDECHLLWGDVLGYVWGRRGEAIEIPMLNEKERQTFYGAVNLITQDFHLCEATTGDGENTVAFVKSLQKLHPDAQMWIIWDGAKHHRYGKMKEYLEDENEGLEEEDWRITCLWFAPNAPEQNPVEDIWLVGKNAIRKAFNENKTFAKVKKCFQTNVEQAKLGVEKLNWYWKHPQTI
jgi:putative transposase